MSQLFELVYYSIANPSLTQEHAQSIAQTASQFNKELNITGLLCFDGYYFLQIIEGAEEDVSTLYEMIKHDPRHRDIEMLHKGNIENRSFQDWTMAFKSVENEVLTALTQGAAIMNSKSHDGIINRAKSYGSQLFSLFMITAFEA